MLQVCWCAFPPLSLSSWISELAGTCSHGSDRGARSRVKCATACVGSELAQCYFHLYDIGQASHIAEGAEKYTLAMVKT